MQPVSAVAVEYLCWNMREVDAREIYGMRAHDNPIYLAREILTAASLGKAAIAEHRGRPCGIVGVSPLWPTTWTVWSFGTNDWPKAVLDMTRYGLRVLKPWLLERGATRLQCESRFDHTEAHSWLEAMGASSEGVLRNFGRDGADYISFSWVN